MDTDSTQATSATRFSVWEKSLPDTDHVRWVKSIDWSKTGIGASIQDWPVELLLWTQQLLADSRPTTIYWGPSNTIIYNEAFLPLAGNNHPTCMGSTFLETYPEIDHLILPMFRDAREARAAQVMNKLHLILMRNGFLEETYFTGNFTPLYRLNGEHAGFYNAVMEVTEQNINERRRDTLNQIPRSAAPLTTTTVWRHMTEVLRTNGYDFPFVLLYQLKEEVRTGNNHRLILQGCIGATEDHPVAVKEASIDDDVGLMPLLHQAKDDIFTRELGEDELQNIQWAGHGSPSKYISAAPLRNAGKLYGHIITAFNPRRPLGDDWPQFMLDLSNGLASTIASTVTTEEAARRESRLQDQILESEKQIRYMAQHSDISMQQLSLDRRTIWANEHYQKVLGGQDDHAYDNFLFEDSFLEEDRDKAIDIWEQVVMGQKARTAELRMRRTYITPDGGKMPTTILLSAFPYMVNGRVQSVMACMTEVTQLKWAEALQATIARDANQAKKLQSQFTDAISHEVRNPLSAMLQLADDILASTARWQEQRDPRKEYTTQTLSEITDAAKTIILCANHQKRIVDDVLTLSKMDLAEMTLKPTATRLEDMVKHAVKILEADITAGRIEVKLVEKPSLKPLALDLVMCDSLRITQILINLLSNAIKFTKLEAQRKITMRYGATSSDPQTAFPPAIKWASHAGKQMTKSDIFSDAKWGNGEQIYLTFQVEDTGLGMDEEEMQRVFDRFEQATPQTSIKYGGSGLGLFICRSLAQKQCGGIGLSSSVGKGTTLAFYVGCRKADSKSATSPIPKRAISGNSEAHLAPENKRHRNGIRINQPIIRTKPTDKPLSHDYHILLVEDNIINQRILAKQLTRAGCQVHLANHGLEALDFLHSTTHWKGRDDDTIPVSSEPIPLDVILMDLNMPIMDGLTCTTKIRDLENTGALASHVEIIAVTANARQEQTEQAQSAGVDAILRKPFVVSELLALVEERLGKRRQE